MEEIFWKGLQRAGYPMISVQTEDGVEHELSFCDPARLVQEIENELAEGKPGFITSGLIVAPEVKKIISQIKNARYFQSA